MFACIFSACLAGSQVLPVRIEVDIQPGLPYFSIIGLADKRIDEARERVRSAIKNSGIPFPLGKVTVNLCPSDLPKHGTGLDLGIALGILIASNKAPPLPRSVWVLGELSLDGNVQRVTSLLPVLFEMSNRTVDGCIMPSLNANDASLLPQCKGIFVNSLMECLSILSKTLVFTSSISDESAVKEILEYTLDHIQGQIGVKRLLGIALSGNHSLLLSGPPGTGKTMLAQAAHELLPPLSGVDLIDVARVYSYAQEGYDLIKKHAPLRSPHYTASVAALYGGGVNVRPGEISLAHLGILLLDELPRYSRKVREVLLKPMEEKQVRIHRNGIVYSYPADSLIIATQNACPCGRLNADGGGCICSAGELHKYRQLLSEPLLDRFELFQSVETPSYSEILETNGVVGEQSGTFLAATIVRTREVQKIRNGGVLNNRMANDALLQSSNITLESHKYFKKAVQEFNLSVRGMYNVLKVARTIADMAGEPLVLLLHIQEALQYRRRVEY